MTQQFTVLARGTKAEIEAIVGLPKGAIAYAIDTNEFGSYNSIAWAWGQGVGTDTPKIYIKGTGEYPTLMDDSAHGYKEGDIWIIPSEDLSWQCVDDAPTYAFWYPNVLPIVPPVDNAIMMSLASDRWFARTMENFVTRLRGSGTDEGNLDAVYLLKKTNLTSIDDTGIANNEIAIFDLTNKKLKTSDKVFSTDGTLAGNSDTNVPTEKAVKSYVDANSGVIVQIVNAQYTAVNSGTTQMPYDDTIPQNTEGVEFMTLAITPTSSTNKLRIEITAVLHESANAKITAALFQDSVADALAAVADERSSSFAISPMTFSYTMTAGTTSPTTFKVRAGLSAAGTITLNGASGVRRLGGVSMSSITITEYTP